MKEVICICCPKGCHLQVDEQNDYAVTGNGCPNGIAYGKEELTNPTRIVTSTVRVTGGKLAMASVKTASDIPKGRIFDCVKALKDVEIPAPVTIGQVVLKDAAGTGVDIIATKNVPVA